MSLFPAYETKQIPEKNSSQSPILGISNEDDPTCCNWLVNSSFKPEISTRPRVIILSSDSSDCELIESVAQDPKQKPPSTTELTLSSDDKLSSSSEKPSSKKSHAKKRKKKKHRKTEKHTKTNLKEPDYESFVKDLYFTDKIRDKGNLKVDTLCSRARPLYHYSTKTLGFIRHKSDKKGNVQRYYSKPINVQKQKPKNINAIIQKTKKNLDAQEEQQLQEENEKIIAAEELKKLKIKEFNHKLADDPHNINLWLGYINLEDRDHEFECDSEKETEVPKYQRKLAIVEKALEKNPSSKELLKAKLKLLNELFPTDQYSNQVESMLSQDPSNILLWKSLITAIRSSIAMSTASKVIDLYSKCFATLHSWSRVSSKTYDSSLLNMLYQLLILLRHSGYWERMWETIRFNLNLNLSITKESYRFRNGIDEKKLIEMEEVILISRLPLNQLWLRIELLRENSHWMSVSKDQLKLIGDTHRFISPEDITDFVNPLLSRESSFRMSIYFLMALKVPLLPCRHQVLVDLGIEEWCLDSLESLLPILYPCAGEIAGHERRDRLSEGLFNANLTSGPQYIKYHPAQEYYLDFIRDVFRVIAESLTCDLEKTSVYIWWIRFERIAYWLNKKDSIKNEKSSKKLKAALKEFLKQEDKRNNLHYYREYALVERELGRTNNCVNILETSIETKGNILADADKKDQEELLSLYRTLLEVLLDVKVFEDTPEHKNRILKIFNSNNHLEAYLEHHYKEFVNQPDNLKLNESLETCFLPNFYVDVVACYVYYLITNGANLEEIVRIFDECLEKSRENLYLHERFCENKIAVLELMFERSVVKLSVLDEHVKQAIEWHPDNSYLLSVIAVIESELPHWSLCTRTSNNHRPWATIAYCLAIRARLHTSISLNNPVAITAAVNKLLHFHKRLARNAEIRSCPLIWRLYMLVLREQNLCEKKGEEVYHESVAYCPWARCIYIDAAEIAPQLLTQIQDVIREKDLRMHVTPEELDILRV